MISSRRETQKLKPGTFSFSESKPQPSQAQPPKSSKRPAPEMFPDSVLDDTRKLTEQERPKPPAKSPHMTKASRGLRIRSMAGWNAVLLLAAPIALFLSLLVGSSYLFSSDVKTGRAFKNAVFSDLRRVAPTTLRLKDLEFKSVVLDNGEDVFVLSGSIENAGSIPVTDVQLQALAFDASGAPVSSTIISAGSTLARTRIRSLSLDMIADLQTREQPSRATVNPDEVQKFSIAMLNGNLEKARFYSVRVYSVR